MTPSRSAYNDTCHEASDGRTDQADVTDVRTDEPNVITDYGQSCSWPLIAEVTIPGAQRRKSTKTIQSLVLLKQMESSVLTWGTA